MTVGKDRDGTKTDLTDEIDRTMAEAEAAVSGSTDLDDEPELEIEDGSAEAADDASAQVARLEDELSATKDKWLRAVADLENYKKRVKREMDEAVLRATQQLLSAFLPVMDNLERALEVAEPAANNASDDNAKNVQNLVLGIRMVKDEFLGALSRHGIEPVGAVGEPFDPSVHDALQQMDSPDHAPGVVIREFEKGYRMGERLLRPARVIVAGSGSTGSFEASEE